MPMVGTWVVSSSMQTWEGNIRVISILNLQDNILAVLRVLSKVQSSAAHLDGKTVQQLLQMVMQQHSTLFLFGVTFGATIEYACQTDMACQETVLRLLGHVIIGWDKPFGGIPEQDDSSHE